MAVTSTLVNPTRIYHGPRTFDKLCPGLSPCFCCDNIIISLFMANPCLSEQINVFGAGKASPLGPEEIQFEFLCEQWWSVTA